MCLFNNLSKAKQAEILTYLIANDFPAAKKLYDYYMFRLREEKSKSDILED